MREEPRAISALVPAIIGGGSAADARKLVERIGRRPATLPEAFILLSAPSLRQDDLKAMASCIFGGEWTRAARFAAFIAGHMGMIGFSFPKWRFLTQSFAGMSLAERFGLKAMIRSTDVLDPNLPDPRRDLFGKGFVAAATDSYVEFRRAYVLSSTTFKERPVTVLVRNSSFHFGRDRLRWPAYVSWDRLSVEQLEALTPEAIDQGDTFIPWQNVLNHVPAGDADDRVRATAEAFTQVSRIERDMDRWLRHGGRPWQRRYDVDPDGSRHLQAFLENCRQRTSGKPFLGEVRFDMPPWFPTSVQSLDGDLSPLLNPGQTCSRRLTFLSGQNGDLPC